MTRAAGRLAAALAVALLAARAAPQPARPDAPSALASAMEEAWRARDAARFLALWRFPSDAARDAERELLHELEAAEESVFSVQARPAEGGRAIAAARLFAIREPRGRVAHFRYLFEKGPDGWAVVGREGTGQIDGLVHLALAPTPYRADGLELRLPDFTLAMGKGWLFSSPAAVGPTVFVFVGEATVRFSPRPEAERQQVAQFSGRPELVERVRSAFVRLHPADLHRVLVPARLEEDPAGAARAPLARRVYDEHVSDSFILDTTLPRSPWWLLPGVGDALVAFRTARHGTLTFTVSRSEPEGLSLFDRRRRRQIALYPLEGRGTDYDEDESRSVDVLHHDLAVRFEPLRRRLEGAARIRLLPLAGAHTVNLRLDDSLRVGSIRSEGGGEHLFFRVRHQAGLMVSLGPLAGETKPIELEVRFGGIHRPAAVEREVLQASPFEAGAEEEDVPVLDDVLVYSNRTAWHPQGAPDDHATALVRLDAPPGMLAVTGGPRLERREENGRVVTTFRQERPAKYITAAVGRLVEGGRAEAAGVRLQAYSVPRARGTAAAVLAQAADIFEFFTGEFGPSPYPDVNVVVMESRVPGGHSPPGMVVLAVRPPMARSQLRDDPAAFWHIPGFFLAHEIAHQWWGHGVAGQNYHERWISEALAQYAAALWARKTHGEARFREVLGRMAQWAVARTHEGPIHLGHRLGHLKGDPQTYRAVVYDKGAYVLHMLRGVVGEEAYRRALTEVQQKHRYGKAGTEDLRRAMEAASGRDLQPYFDAWVYGTRLPRLAVRSRLERAAALVDVDATDLPGEVPLRIDVRHDRGTETQVVRLAPRGGSFRIEAPARARRVEVNGDRGLLAVITKR